MKSDLLLYSLLITQFSGFSAHAIPVLSENAAQDNISGLTLYPDSDPSKNLYYYMPNTSGFQTEPVSKLPMFGFTYWGLGAGQAIENAGALLSFTSHLYSDNQQKAALEAFLKSGKHIAVLPILESTVGLTTTKKDGIPLGRIFDEFNFSNRGGMAEDDIGVNAILNGIGAKVFKAAIETPDLFKVDYCFKVQGLGPNFKGTVIVDYNRVYDDFQFHASVNGWWVKASIDAQIEKLYQNGAITIDIEGGTAKEEEYLKNVAEKIVARLFVPELQAAPTQSSTPGGWSFTRFALKTTHKSELKSETYKLTKRDLTVREFCIPITLSGLKPYYKDIVRNADEEGISK